MSGAQQGGARLREPSALSYDAAGNLYIADAKGHQVLEATLGGALVVVAGTGVQGFAGDQGPATAAELNSPQGLAIGVDGTLYIADTGNARIRTVSGGVISTFAGTGVSGFGGDGGAAAAARFRSPTALALDASGALLVCDTADHRVRRIRNGQITTIAGTGVQGFAGDNGLATAAELDSPSGVVVSPGGQIFLADTHNQRVRVIAPDGTITTFAGRGARGYAGDGGQAGAAELSMPRGLAVTPGGTLLIADGDNQRVRSVSPAGVMTTLAGSGTEGASEDGAQAAQASLRTPGPLAISSFGMPVIGDSLNGTVRLLTGAGTLYEPAALSPGRVSDVQGNWTAPQIYGQVGGSIAVNGPVGVPQGAVTVSEAGSALATGVLSGGQASFALPALGAGAHSLTVSYAGDGLNPAVTGTVTSLNVAAAVVTASAQSATSEYGAALPAFSGVLAGVLPRDAGQVDAVYAPNPPTGANPQTPLPVGSYRLTASLTGPKSANYTLQMAADSGTLQITQAGSRTALGSVGQSYAGVPLQLSASVASSTTGQPTGTVQFLDGVTVVGTGTLVNGRASAVYTAPVAGTATLTASYSGDSNFTPSISAPAVAVVCDLPDFTLSVAGTATATVSAGSMASYTLQIGAAPAPFTGIVTLSASGLPPGASVVFSPVQVVPGTGSAAVSVSLLTAAPAVSLRRDSGSYSRSLWAVAGCLFCLGCFGPRRAKMLSLLAAGMMLCGCGARTVGEGVGGVISQGYSVQITGTSTNLLGAVVTHSTVLTLTVQQ